MNATFSVVSGLPFRHGSAVVTLGTTPASQPRAAPPSPTRANTYVVYGKL